MSRTLHRRPRHSLPMRRAAVGLGAASIGLLAAAVLVSTAGSVSAADAKVDLGATASFAVLAGSTITNTGPSGSPATSDWLPAARSRGFRRVSWSTGRRTPPTPWRWLLRATW